MLQRRIALPIDAEQCVVLTLNEPVPSLVAVLAPRLHGQRDVCIGAVFRRS